MNEELSIQEEIKTKIQTASMRECMAEYTFKESELFINELMKMGLDEALELFSDSEKKLLNRALDFLNSGIDSLNESTYIFLELVSLMEKNKAQ